MRILAVYDGSDDGYAGLQTVAQLLTALGTSNEFTLAVVGWPPRPSPIWDRAFEQQGVVDDLHRAMAEVAAFELERMRKLFSPLGAIQTEYLEGDPTPEVVALASRVRAELIVAGLTRGQRVRSVTDTLLAILEHTSIPTLVTFGPRTEREM